MGASVTALISGRATFMLRRYIGKICSIHQRNASGTDSSRRVSPVGAASTTSIVGAGSAMIVDAQQVGQLLHPGDDRHLFGDRPIHTATPGQGSFQPLPDCSPVGLHVVVDVGLLGP